MNKNLLLACALLLPLTGCVTETTLVGDKSQRSGNIDTQSAAATRLKLGLGYLEKGEMAQAKMNLEKAEEFDPNNPEILLAKIYYYQKVGDTKQAEQGYKDMLSRYPGNADALNNYGVFLCGNARYAEADKFFMQAVQVPNYNRMDDTYENAATCAYKAGKKSQAVDYLDKALGYSPLSGKLLLVAATLAMDMGNTTKAAYYMQRYGQTGRASAQSLWLQLELADRNGELAQVQKIGAELVKLFPTSAQAKRYLNNDY